MPQQIGFHTNCYSSIFAHVNLQHKFSV